MSETPDRRAFLALPLEERRRLLEIAAADPEVQAYYNALAGAPSGTAAFNADMRELGDAIERQEPHGVTERQCSYCAHSWIAVHPMTVDPEQLECPECGIQETE